MLTEVTETDFEENVMGAGMTVLVDFWAPWCGPCRMLEPALKRLGIALSGQLSIVKVDISAQRAIADRFDVKSTPTLILFRDGAKIDQRVGALPGAAISDWVSSALTY